MISAVFVACMMSNPMVCMTVAAPQVLKSIQECEAGVPLVRENMEQNGFLLMDYRCVNWGTPA